MTLINLGNHTRYQRLPSSAANDLDDSEDESVADDLDEDGRPLKKKKPFWSYILQICELCTLIVISKYSILPFLSSYFASIWPSIPYLEDARYLFPQNQQQPRSFLDTFIYNTRTRLLVLLFHACMYRTRPRRNPYRRARAHK